MPCAFASRRAVLASLASRRALVVGVAQNGWKTYGNDPGHTRFSTLTQITPENVTRLTKAWEFDTQDARPQVAEHAGRHPATMYITLQNGGVVALEPETGKELWRFETPVRGRSVRAVAYWPGDDEPAPRLLYGASDKLIALDPITGKPDRELRQQGRGRRASRTAGSRRRGAARAAPSDTDAGAPARRPPRDAARRRGAGRTRRRGGGGGFGSGFSISSPPAIYKNLAILGGSEGENAVVGPPGDPQAFDVKTGKLVWRFHAVPQPGERNAGTWGDGWKDRGGPADLGTHDRRHRARHGVHPDRQSGRQLLRRRSPGRQPLRGVGASRSTPHTGAYKWHFQTTHHDVFDADLAAAPALIDVVQQRQAHSRRRAGHEDGRHAVHPRSPDRQADLSASRNARCRRARCPAK